MLECGVQRDTHHNNKQIQTKNEISKMVEMLNKGKYARTKHSNMYVLAMSPLVFMGHALQFMCIVTLRKTSHC